MASTLHLPVGMRRRGFTRETLLTPRTLRFWAATSFTRETQPACIGGRELYKPGVETPPANRCAVRSGFTPT